MHGTSNTSNQWTKKSILMTERLGVRGSSLQALDFDDMYEELLFMEKDLVVTLQSAPAHTDAHSDALSISKEAGSDGNDAVSVDWEEWPAASVFVGDGSAGCAISIHK
jgi:hypothetical protein